MDNISYHGTNKAAAQLIVGPPTSVNVNKGKGELGRGFYTGSSISLAASWAFTRYNDDAHVVMIDIPIQNFVKLRPYILRNEEEVQVLWERLKTEGTKATFEFGCDYAVAPLATIRENGKQFKFESLTSESVINNSTLTLLPCV